MKQGIAGRRRGRQRDAGWAGRGRARHGKERLGRERERRRHRSLGKPRRGRARQREVCEDKVRGVRPD